MVKKLSPLICILIFIRSISISQPNCCCGSIRELSFPGFDFEFPPDPPFAGALTYCAGPFGPWTVTKSCVDHVNAYHYNGGLGNPNGPSNFVDLWGGPIGGPFAAGTIEYTLSGLTAGYLYTLEFYYAKFQVPVSTNIIGNVKVAKGAWLNKTWTATNFGNVIWLKASYNFIAQASSTTLEFSDAGSVSPGWPSGMLIDDIKLFECPGDLEDPIVTNPPDDLNVNCDSQIPPVPTLDVNDNCDLNPVTVLNVTTKIIDPCTKIITRNWEIKDDCGNITELQQTIEVSDTEAPVFNKVPENKSVNCDKDVLKEFSNWIKANGNSDVSDDCMTIHWEYIYDRLPEKFCDEVQVEFIAKDHCGNTNSEIAIFKVIDTTAPRFLIQAESKNYNCVLNTRDSLRTWLKANGFSKNGPDCSSFNLYSDFNGDSTQNPLFVTFYAEDNCGNIDSTKASFAFRFDSDTFRITNYSCDFTHNTLDTSKYSSNGCDSFVILEQIKIVPDSMHLQLYTCDRNQKKYDTLTLVNNKGCDSLIFTEYILKQLPVTTLQIMDCKFTQFKQDSSVLMGQYCDSIVITEYIPLRKDTNTIILNTCDKNQVDTIMLSFTNSLGCDSLVTIFTVYIAEKVTFVEKKICGLNTEYTDTIKYLTGLCDSFVITSHTSLPLDTTNIQSITCEKSKAGIFSNNFINQYGCDSVVLEEILFSSSDTTFVFQPTCFLSQAGIKFQRMNNSFGCDSIIQTTTDFIVSDTIQVKQTTCDISKVRLDTIVFSHSPCDSVVLFETVFVPSDTTSIIKTSCDPSKVGLETIILKGKVCDSVVYIDARFIPADTVMLSQTSCDPAITGLSTVLLQNVNGCDSLILINTNYVPFHLEIDLDSITCFNQQDGAIKILNSSDFNKPYELILNNNRLGNLDEITNLGPGSYELYLRDQKGCITDSIQFILTNPAELIIDLGNDLVVKKGARINLNLQSNRALQNIYWGPAKLTNCTNCNKINFVIDEDTWVYTQVIDEDNCVQTDSIFIRVKKSTTVFAPNSFTPNGDNINDYFYIQGDVNAIVEIMFIYDRWGNKLFETQNVRVNEPLLGWNGTFKSEKMNPGVFVYYAKVKKSDDEVTELKGDINLIR